jgi:hypothetical protein
MLSQAIGMFLGGFAAHVEKYAGNSSLAAE